jgi:hypothetical protein
MSAFVSEVARLRRAFGCSGGPSRSSSQEDEAWQMIGKRLSEPCRETEECHRGCEQRRTEEVRFFGDVDASDVNMCEVIQHIVAKFHRVHACYEAGATYYGLYRLIRSLGYERAVVALSMAANYPVRTSVR